jgi:adenylate kinase family enzyme
MGKLVPDEVLIGIIEDRLKQVDAKRIYTDDFRDCACRSPDATLKKMDENYECHQH